LVSYLPSACTLKKAFKSPKREKHTERRNNGMKRQILKNVSEGERSGDTSLEIDSVKQEQMEIISQFSRNKQPAGSIFQDYSKLLLKILVCGNKQGVLQILWN
ncbi:hypothetical protein ATANTOWER_006915, partial [Ataeniobius toweri]|nr:hypothetical protein [Ataeniobius toweri]